MRKLKKTEKKKDSIFTTAKVLNLQFILNKKWCSKCKVNEFLEIAL